MPDYKKENDAKFADNSILASGGVAFVCLFFSM